MEVVEVVVVTAFFGGTVVGVVLVAGLGATVVEVEVVDVCLLYTSRCV